LRSNTPKKDLTASLDISDFSPTIFIASPKKWSNSAPYSIEPFLFSSNLVKRALIYLLKEASVIFLADEVNFGVVGRA